MSNPAPITYSSVGAGEAARVLRVAGWSNPEIDSALNAAVARPNEPVLAPDGDEVRYNGTDFDLVIM